MKEQTCYLPFPNFVLRTPLLPLSSLSHVLEHEDAIQDLWTDPAVREAIFIASPELFVQTKRWMAGELKDAKKIDGLRNSLLRYLIRMSSRPTPFGLFAGSCIGEWSDRTDLRLQSGRAGRKRIRLGMEYLVAFAEEISKIPEIRDSIRYFPNSTIYRFGDQIRYIERRLWSGLWVHDVVAVQITPELLAALEASRNGVTLPDLALLFSNSDISLNEALIFAQDLASSQILANELSPNVTGEDYFGRIVRCLQRIPRIDEIKRAVVEAERKLDELNNQKPGVEPTEYESVLTLLDDISTPLGHRCPFQVDLFKKKTSCKLDRAISDSVLEAILVINRLSSFSPNKKLESFKSAFVDRFGAREVPLLEALDVETGLGYGAGETLSPISPLISGLNLHSDPGIPPTDWNPASLFVFQKGVKALKEGAYEINLTEQEVQRFPVQLDIMPDTLSAFVRLLSNGLSRGEQAKVQLLMIFASAANLLGRFSDRDEEFEVATSNIARKEAELHPEAILAEVLHVPLPRLGNVMHRSILREFEIPFMFTPSVDARSVISLQDLLVCVRGDRIVLKSNRLGREVLPKSSSAHNTTDTLPHYEFLCDLQHQNRMQALRLDWGPLLYASSFIPRVTYKQVILYPACWTFERDQLSGLEAKEEPKLVEEVHQWRAQYQIPRWVALRDGDNELSLDLDNLHCLRLFRSIVRKRDRVSLVEHLQMQNVPSVQAEDGFYSNEFVVSYHRS